MGILLLILLLAAILRLVKLDEIPPGLHVDEAANAWNAYTLLKTGKDQHGVSWPIFFTRVFGDNRTTTYMYAALPFVAIGGMNVWTTRVPAATGGVITVLLIYLIGARLFDRWTGLVAAAMLAVNPWHVQVSRFGHEATLVPLLITGTLAAFLWANLPIDDNYQRQPRPWAAALAGLVAGIGCYGYFAIRLFLPVFLLSVVLVTWRGWRNCLQTRNGSLAICGLLLVGAITAGPLFWKHITYPELAERGRTAGWVWNGSDTLGEKVGKVMSRYPGHFGLDFLFMTGDKDPALSPPTGMGLFYWYDLPLMLIGAVALALRLKRSPAARILLLWIVLYPIADLLNQHVSLHSLRSLPGLCGLILLSAVGAVTAGKWLSTRPYMATAVSCAMAVLVLSLNTRFIWSYFRSFRFQKYPVMAYASDVLEATQWLRPRLKDVDAVFVTGSSTHPYITTLIGLDYDPQQWFRDTREIMPGPLPGGAYKYEDVYLRYGKMHFMFGDSSVAALETLLHNGKPDRVVFIVRPGELGLHRHARPVHEIRNAEGQAVLWIFDIVL